MEESLQTVARQLRNFPGKVKGEIFITHESYIRLKEGEIGVKKVEKKMKELGFPIDFNKVKPFEWQDESTSSLVIVVAKNIFNWTEEDVFEMGRFSPRFSFILKLMTKYIISVESLFLNASKYWQKHQSVGYIVPVELNEREKRVVIRVMEFATHPLVCIHRAGYFKGLCEFAIKGKNINIKETACIHNGADYHEYLIQWE